MAPRAPIDKWVNGKRLSQSQFRHLVISKIKKIAEFGTHPQGVRAKDVCEILGDPAWLEPANLHLMATTLNNFKEQGLLKSGGWGLFLLHKPKIDMGLDQREEYEIMLVEALEREGGFAQRSTLNKHLGCEVGDGTYVQLTQVLSTSQVIRRDYAGAMPALYNLGPDHLSRLPLRGRWLRLQIIHGYQMLSGQSIDDVWDIADARARHRFKEVGAAFKAVMDLTGSDLLQAMDEHPPLARAMQAYADHHPDRAEHRRAALRRYDLVSGDLAAKLLAEGQTHDQVEEAREAAKAQFDEEFLAFSYDLFTQGDYGSHTHAPAALYTAFATWAQVDAALLSRGEIAPDLAKPPSPTKLGPMSDAAEEAE